ncbi:MAG: hypothetical protein M5U28_31760 [Sandaracinaceae bacterium]|nr:hypothetical protein [Sandaracinaceae bacterium]
MRWMIACIVLAVAVGCGPGAALDAGTDAPADAGTDAGDPPVVPDQVCPGGEGCADEGDGVLHAGAAAFPITPSLDDVEPLPVDVDGDGFFDPLDGDVFEDQDGDGIWDAIWIAGFGNGRAATDIGDDVWARAVALRQGETTIAFVSIDSVGWFLDDADAIRAQLGDVDVDFVLVASTHSHETRDTIGIWGRTLDETGRDEAYMEFVVTQAARAVREAVAALAPAHVQYASLRVRDQPGGTRRYVGDNRDPQIIDDEVRILRFLGAEDGATIATLVNLGAHPEYMGSRNTRVSSDFPTGCATAWRTARSGRTARRWRAWAACASSSTARSAARSARTTSRCRPGTGRRSARAPRRPRRRSARSSPTSSCGRSAPTAAPSPRRPPTSASGAIGSS